MGSGGSFTSQRAAEGFIIASFLKIIALRGGSGTYLLTTMFGLDQIHPVSVQLSKAGILRGSRVILGTWPYAASSCFGVWPHLSARGVHGSSWVRGQQSHPTPALSANLVWVPIVFYGISPAILHTGSAPLGEKDDWLFGAYTCGYQKVLFYVCCPQILIWGGYKTKMCLIWKQLWANNTPQSKQQDGLYICNQLILNQY